MSIQDVVVFLGAFGLFLGVLGSGGRWLLNLIVENTSAAEKRESLAREELSDMMKDQLAELRAELAKVQADKTLYLQRIYQLEHFIHQQPGISIPTMEGWPPV